MTTPMNIYVFSPEFLPFRPFSKLELIPNDDLESIQDKFFNRYREEVERRGLKAWHLVVYLMEVPIPKTLSRAARNEWFRKHRDQWEEYSNQRLSSMWDKITKPDHACLAIMAPPSVEEDLVEDILVSEFNRTLNILKHPAPSSIARSSSVYLNYQRDMPIYNGRPEKNTGHSVCFMDRHLAQIAHELGNLETVSVSPKVMGKVSEFMRLSCDIYQSEAHRELKCTELLFKLLRVPRTKLPSTSGISRVEADSLSIENGVLYLTYECKNELGQGGDAMVQAAATYRRHISERSYTGIRNVSKCPCVLITASGSRMHIAGAIFNIGIIVQELLPTGLSLQIGTDADKATRQVAAALTVISNGLQGLRAACKSLVPSSSPKPLRSRFFPDPLFLPGEHGPQGLKYIEPFIPQGYTFSSNPTRLIYHAELDGKNVLIKFCKRYGAEAHKILAELHPELVPPLHHFVRLRGESDLYMVVMGFCDGDNLHGYISKFSTTLSPRSGVFRDVHTAITTLHNNGFVFGDLRAPNVIVVQRVHPADKSGEQGDGLGAMLVDFDWAGQAGIVKYPANINQDIMWPQGVQGATTIQREHDEEMYTQLLKEFSV